MQVTMPNMQVTMANTPEALSYAILAALGINVVLAVLLAVRGDWLGVVLVLAIACGIHWFLCRRLVTIVRATTAAAAGTVLSLAAAVADLACGHPYYGILFLFAAAALAFAFVLLRQGARPADLRLGGIAAVDISDAATHVAMLAHLRDAGILTAAEYAEKSAILRV